MYISAACAENWGWLRMELNELKPSGISGISIQPDSWADCVYFYKGNDHTARKVMKAWFTQGTSAVQ
jgi:hypothetical protein